MVGPNPRSYVPQHWGTLQLYSFFSKVFLSSLGFWLAATMFVAFGQAFTLCTVCVSSWVFFMGSKASKMISSCGTEGYCSIWSKCFVEYLRAIVF